MGGRPPHWSRLGTWIPVCSCSVLASPSIKNRPPSQSPCPSLPHSPTATCKSASSDGWILAPRSFLTLPSLSFSAVFEARCTSSFAHHGYHHGHHHVVSTSTVNRGLYHSIVGLTLFRAETRPFRVSTPQTHTTRFSKKSQSTMFNSTGSSASGRYAHSHDDPRDPEIGDSDSRDRLGTSGCKTTSWRRAF